MEAKNVENLIEEKRGKELMELVEEIEEKIEKYKVTLSEWQGIQNALDARQNQMINAKLYKKYVKPE